MTINVTDAVGANNTIVFDSNSKIPAIDGSQVTALSGSAFTTGSLATARIDVGTGANQILQLDANAKLPAVSAINLTGIVGPTVSTSDPAIDTNSTLGKKWINKTSGEVYICTDATTDENVWTNVGDGTGDIAPFVYQGTSYGYSLGGHLDYNVIQKFSFTSDGNSSDVGDLLASTYNGTGSQSATHGYYINGYNWISGSPAVQSYDIQKFSFASGGDAVDTGYNTFTEGTEYGKNGHSSSTDGNYCYLAGGYNTTSGDVSSIQRFAFDISANTIDVGDLSVRQQSGWGWSYNNTHGYHAGGAIGYVAPGWSQTNTAVILKYAFAASGVTSSNVGNLTVARRHCHGQGINSTTHGYVGGGDAGSNDQSNVVDRMSFASDGNATDHGDLHEHVSYGAGNATSTTHGYVFGGIDSSETKLNKIQKFAFSSNTTGTDVGDLTGTSANDSGGTIKAVSGCHN
jgi:hypothetical protein